MSRQADDRPSGSPLPGDQADGSASAVDEAASWLEEIAGVVPERKPVALPEAGNDPAARTDGSRQARGDRRTDQATPTGPDPDQDSPPADPAQLGPDADAEEVARKILLDQLTGQARSRAELAVKLARRRVPDEVAERLLNRFEEVGLVDDAAFARAWVESRRRSKGLGRRALAQELRRKGVDDELVRTALDEVEPDDEEASARELVRRRLRTLRGVDRVTATRRLAGMLARKGHRGDVVWRVVREELDDAGGPGEGSDGDARDGFGSGA